MATRHEDPPWDFLCLASQPALQDYELTRLNHAANLRKEMACLMDEWLENTACGLLARWLLEHWAQLRPPNLLEQLPDSQGDLFTEFAFAIHAQRGPEADAAD